MALLILYEHINFGGRQMPITQDAPSLGNFDKITSSFEIRDGNWSFFIDTNFAPQSRRGAFALGPGRYPWVEAVGIPNDSIRSVSMVVAHIPVPPEEASHLEPNPNEVGLSELKQ